MMQGQLVGTACTLTTASAASSPANRSGKLDPRAWSPELRKACGRARKGGESDIFGRPKLPVGHVSEVAKNSFGLNSAGTPISKGSSVHTDITLAKFQQEGRVSQIQGFDILVGMSPKSRKTLRFEGDDENSQSSGHPPWKMEGAKGIFAVEKDCGDFGHDVRRKANPDVGNAVPLPGRKQRMTMYFEKQRRLADGDVTNAMHGDTGECEAIFREYCSGKTADGRKCLMTKQDLHEFFLDFKDSFPTTKLPSDKRFDQVWNDTIQLQVDLCRKFQLTRIEANQGLCFESFQVILGNTIKGRSF
jgi:hypothetical protein